MALVVNTNVASLNTQRQLRGPTGGLSRSFQRLSSGLRINSAADDVAGMAIGERFVSQVRGLDQAARNANDGISLMQVAEGALIETTSVLQRIRELSIQSASDINTEADRAAIQDEVAQLITEIERIGETTTFNHQRVLSGEFIDQMLHVGMGFRERLGLTIPDARSRALGRWAVQTGVAVTTAAIGAGQLLVNGVTIRASTVLDDTLSTSFAAGSARAKATAINDLTAFHGVTAVVNATVRESAVDTGGGTLDQDDYIQINGVAITGLTIRPDDANETLINAINAEVERTGVVASRDRFGRLALRAEDGRNIAVDAFGNGGAITGLGAGSVAFGSLTLHSPAQYRITVAAAGAGGRIGFDDDALVGVGAEQATHLIDVSTRDGANLGILVADRALQQVADIRSRLGAVQNRLESTINNLSTHSENASAARSRIVDADFAEETSRLARQQVLLQAGTAILAQANSQPQNALSLLG